MTLAAQTVAIADSSLHLSPGFPSETILIVDDFALWRAQVRRILAVRPEWKIVGEACDGLEAVQKATELQPDIILLDITMPGLNGIEAAKLIRQQSPKSAIIFLTMNDDQDILDAALAVSSAGYVLKVNAHRDLCAAITSRGTPFYRLASADFQHRACAAAGVAVKTSPGEWLRGLREELHLTCVAVERLTSEIARRANDERYRIRRGRLADMEDDKASPDIFEAKSFSKCYRVAYRAILQAFGVRLENSEDVPQGPTHSGETAKQWSFTDADRPFSLTFQSNISFDQTRLVTESAEELGVPAIVRQRLDAGQFRLGIIGLNDDTMDDLVPGGSVVVIDKSHHTVEMREWKTIQERPIYFVWHEDGYSCSWCNVVRDTLFIVPYPTSRRPVMIFKMPRAATVIGRVIHVWPPLIIEKRPA